MKAILITPQGAEHVEIAIDTEQQMRDFERLIGCDYFTQAGRPAPDHMAWVDDMGMLKLEHGMQAQLVDWYPQPLVGKVLITGINDASGDTLPATMELERVNAMVLLGTVDLASAQPGIRIPEVDGEPS